MHVQVKEHSLAIFPFKGLNYMNMGLKMVRKTHLIARFLIRCCYAVTKMIIKVC